MNAQSTLLALNASSKQLLDAALAGTDDTTLHYIAPGGTINSPAAIYVHTIVGVDQIVNGMVRQRQTVYESGGWATRTGLPAKLSPAQDHEVASNIHISLPVVQEYSNAVFTSVDEYLGGAADADMERVMSTPFGSEPMSVAALLALILGVHTSGHMGEIAALKGVQGKKGLPF